MVFFRSYLVFFMTELNVFNYTILFNCNYNCDFYFMELQFAKNSTY